MNSSRMMNKQSTWGWEHWDNTDAISVVTTHSGERQQVACGSRFGRDASTRSLGEQGHEDRNSRWR